VLLVVAAVIVLLAFLRTFAVFYTDALWFSSIGLRSEWRSLFEVKAGLAITFAVVFGLLLFASLTVSERLAPSGPVLDAEDEFVRRYQEVVGPRSRWLRWGVVVVVSIILGSQAIGQWQNWILFRNGVPFGVKDPQWHRDVGFYVFKLPFENFLVHWTLVALVVVFVITAVAYYLNAGIRVQGPRPRVRPAVKAHLSVILGLVAIVKAVGYYLARFSLDLSQNGFTQGAGYTDVHARVPALELLILVSLASAALLIYNLRRQGWVLPILGVGLWMLVALTAETIYPAMVQALKVNPAQNTLEQPYIQRNIEATRAAYGLDAIQVKPFAASTTLTANQLNANADTLSNVRLWDPSLTQQTYNKLQDIRSYYQFNALAVDRYQINGVETPTIVGVREVNSQDIPSPSWVNTHLQFTHGYGMVISPANTASPSGQPVFDISDVPPTSSNGLPQITQPAVYFGLDNSGYVVADTKQPEVDYQLGNGNNVETHYGGTGGVRLSSFFDRLMFAVRFSDLNLVISNQLTDNSRLMFDRGVQARVAKAAPFLSLGSSPYPVLVSGHIDWVQNAYTTTDNYPYSQNAKTSALNPASGLPAKFNYIRNSVKAVVNAYTGKITFYVMDPHDPIIRTYERAFPGMFTPASKMSPQLRAHLRYPVDLFTVQASMFGKYHITNAASFYNAADAWTLSPSPGSGSPSQALATTQTTNAQGQLVSTGQVVRMSPLYEEIRVPGQVHQSFVLLDAFTPVSSSSQIQTLSGFMVAGSDPKHYGQLEVFVTPRDQPVDGPSIVAARIDATPAISRTISLLNANGSSVILGNVLMIPVHNSLIYVQSVYVASTRNAIPVLEDVIAVYGNQIEMEPTLGAALSKVFGAAVSTSPSTGTSTALSPQIRAYLNDAEQAFKQAQIDLQSGNLGAYQTDVNQASSDLQEIQALTGGSSSNGSPSSGASSSSSSATGPAPTSSTRRKTGSSATSTSQSPPATATDGSSSSGPVGQTKSASSTTTTTSAA
jgi:uncharacterized membrane protein (UPF0182 family)